MADKFQFELVSPERLLLSEPVGLVVVPGTEGHFGVLPGHALLIAPIKAGIIDVYENGLPTVTDRIFVAGGFAEVTPERCTVLADQAMPLAALDRGAIETEARELDQSIGALRDQGQRVEGAERDDNARALAAALRRRALAQAKLDALAATAP